MDRAQSDRLGSAFNLSVYLMLGVPAMLLGGLITVIVLNVRARARHEGSGSGDPPPPT